MNDSGWLPEFVLSALVLLVALALLSVGCDSAAGKEVMPVPASYHQCGTTCPQHGQPREWHGASATTVLRMEDTAYVHGPGAWLVHGNYVEPADLVQRTVPLPVARDGHAEIIPTPTPTPTATAEAASWPTDRALTEAEMRALAAAVGFTDIDYVIAVAWCESRWRPWATGAESEMGLWQIHPAYHADATYDPLGNARAAYRISAGGTDWSQWACR